MSIQDQGLKQMKWPIVFGVFGTRWIGPINTNKYKLNEEISLTLVHNSNKPNQMSCPNKHKQIEWGLSENTIIRLYYHTNMLIYYTTAAMLPLR